MFSPINYFLLNRNKKLLLLIMFFMGIHPVKSQDLSAPDSLISILSGSFKAKDPSLLQLYLSDDFTIGVYNRPAADRMLQNILDRYPVDSIKQSGAGRDAGNKQISVAFYSKGKKIAVRAYLNNHNKLLNIDLFDQLYGVNRNIPSQLKARIPFRLVNGSIVVTARLNGNSRPLQLLFDTGADGMALKKSIADSMGITASHRQQSTVVGSSMEIAVSSGNTLSLDTLQIPDNNVALFDEIGKGFDGIVGISLARRFITKVNFDQQVIELYSFGSYQYEQGGTAVPVTMPGSVPILPAKLQVGEKEVEGSFIFDTGANYYLIAFGPFVKKNLLLTSGFVPWFSGSTVSMGHATASFTGNFARLSLGGIELNNFPAVLQAHQAGNEDWAGNTAGSLGIKMARRFNFTINLADHQIYFKANKLYKLPLDFVLNAVYFSFNDKGQLQVESVTDEKLREEIQQGDIVTAINGIKAATLLQCPDKIKRLLFTSSSLYTVVLKTDSGEKTIQF
jgi:hypothetical protein